MSSPRMTGRASVNPARGAARPAYRDEAPGYGRGGGGRGPGGGGPGGRGPGGGDGRYGGSYSGRPRVRPRWGRIFLVSGVVLLVLALAAGLGLYSYVGSLNDDMKRTSAFDGLTGDRPPKKVDGALNILILGSDSRDPDAKHEGGSDWRTDTIILMHVPASHDKAYFISLPRDLWVHVPKSQTSEYGGQNAKINAAYAWGGPPLMVQTVEGYSGVRIDHVVIVDFFGFKRMVDTVDGVRLCPEMPPGKTSFKSIHKPYRTFKKGCENMDGAKSLDYIRQRYQFPKGDFARMQHQQQFIKALMDKATSRQVFTSPTKLDNFVTAATKAVTVDEEFSLMDMAIQFRSLRSKDLVFMTTPHKGTGMIDGQSVVLSDKEKGMSLYAAINRDDMAGWLKKNPQKK